MQCWDFKQGFPVPVDSIESAKFGACQYSCESTGIYLRLTKIANTGTPLKGLYKVFTKNESNLWEAQVEKAMGGRNSDPCFNPNLFVIILFVQELKRKLGFAGQNELNCRVKFGLVMTVQDWLQAPHQDCEVTPGNQSWIFHVPLSTSGSYL